MKNIGIIVNVLQNGGAERCAADLSIYFTQKGYNVIIFTDLSYEQKYEYAGELVHFSYTLKSLNEKNPMEAKVDELRQLKTKYKIHISISFMQFANFVNILSKQDEKVILTTHSLNSLYAKSDKSIFWAKETFSELYQYADAITFPSEYCRLDWIEHYGDKNQLTKVMYNPVHEMCVEENKTKDNIVIAIGRMHSIKRQWHIIRAFKLVNQKIPDSKLIILGDGELRDSLVKLIRKLDLEDVVELLGNVINVEEYLAKSKVFIMTSRCEAMPCSVLEALSAGVPVVACDSPGGIREEIVVPQDVEITHSAVVGECGIVTPYIKEYYTEELSVEEKILAEQILLLLNDEELRSQLSDRAKKRAACFSIDIIGKLWIDEIVENKGNCNVDFIKFEEIKKRYLKVFNEKNINYEMYIQYYRILEKWMLLHEKDKNVGAFFERNKMNNIIIYGMGKMAEHLIKDIKKSNINIVCAIEQKSLNRYVEFPILVDVKEIPKADCIVVTPVYDFEKIKKELEMRTSIPIISLTEVVEKAL